MKKWKLYVWMTVLFVVSGFSLAGALTTEEIIQKIVAGHENQMKGVKDYTIITDEYTSYHKRATVEGKTVYKTRTEMEVMGMKFTTIYDGVYQWTVDPVSGKPKKEKRTYDPYQPFENLKTADVEYVGTEKLNGHPAYVLEIKDIIKLMGATKPKEIAKEKVSGKAWVDVENLVPKKMEMTTDIVDEETGERTPVKLTIRLEDYRKIDGMLIAYKTIMTTGGIGNIMEKEITPEGRQEIQKGLEDMERNLREMPPEQRAMAEKMMKPQMEMMRKMLAGGGIETVTEVKDVKVNTGLKDALFDGSELKTE